MSTDTAKTIKRQWHIVLFLANGNYVSTTNIREHLASLGIEVELRTIQRDLTTLKQHFPLECRKDSMPHSWRWEKLPKAVNNLSVTQAVVLSLVEEQLKEVISPRLIQELQPLFAQAKVVTGMTTVTEQIESIFKVPSIKAKSQGGREFGIAGAQSPLHEMLGSVRSWLGSVFTQSKKQDDFKALDSAVSELIIIMREQGLEELVADF